MFSSFSGVLWSGQVVIIYIFCHNKNFNWNCFLEISNSVLQFEFLCQIKFWVVQCLIFSGFEQKFLFLRNLSILIRISFFLIGGLIKGFLEKKRSKCLFLCWFISMIFVGSRIYHRLMRKDKICDTILNSSPSWKTQVTLQILTMGRNWAIGTASTS